MQTLWQDLRYGARMLMKQSRFIWIVVLALCLCVNTAGVKVKAQRSDEAQQRKAIEQIKQAAQQDSQVMEYAFYLSDVYGARLTGSPGFKSAGDWVVQRLRAAGLANVQQEPIPFGRSWSYRKFAVHLLEPQAAALIASPGVWSASTNGVVSGEPMLAPAPTDITKDTYEKYVRDYGGRLRGKVVLLSTPRAVQPQTTAPSRRLTDEELAQMAKAVPPPDAPALPASLYDEFRIWGVKLQQFFKAEGVVALVHQSRGEDGMVVSFGPDWAHAVEVELLPTIFLAAEHYNRVARLLVHRIPVRLSVELEARFHRDADSAFNITAELPGSTQPDDVVMIGAHLDSWTGATGATDNAAGCAVMIEALRILKSLDLKPARTIRLALWGAHEGSGGSAGSVAYIREHFGTAAAPKPAHAKLAAYFNLDNGGGRIRGLYLPRRDAGWRPLFQGWLETVNDLGATTVIPVGKPGGSDHANFHEAGLPGFLFVQDPLDYRTRTRHANLDLYDHLQVDDLKQAAAVIAALAYQVAMSAAPLPRQPATTK
jgi:hypothetical protein